MTFTKMVGLAFAAALLAPVAANAADAPAPPPAFGVCKACHLNPEKNGVGPMLKGVVGRKAAAAEGYAYSDAMKASGLTWDEATLKKYLANPQAVVPKTKMTFAGFKDDAAKIDAVVEYLKTLK